MTYSPDFSSASPASNWVTPPASSIPSADYTYQPDTYADASQSAEAVYVPTAPLMQAPVQDVYSPPAPQPIAGTVSSADSYTPSFAKSSAPEAADAEEANKPMPFMGNHPTQTLLATGTGAFGGALIGGSVKHLLFSGDKDDATPAAAGKTTETKTAAKTATGWEFEGVHPDGVTPKKIKNINTGFTYEIDQATKVVTTKNASGTVVLASTTPTPSGAFTQSGNNLTRTIEHKRLGIKTGTFNETYIKHTPEIIELISHKKGGILSGVPVVGSKMPHLPKYERYLYDKNKGVVVVLNENGDIKKLITGVVSRLQTRNQALAAGTAFMDVAKTILTKPEKTALQDALSSFDAILSGYNSSAKQNFVDRLTERKLFGSIPLVNRIPKLDEVPIFLDLVTKHNNYSENLQAEWTGLQKKIVELAGFDFDGTSAIASNNTYHTNFSTLNAQCKFVPESVAKTTEAAKEAAEKAAKEIKWGELAFPALAGASIVGAGVFVADFILQRRKPKATTAEPQGA
jgi:hypothetical protein